MCEYPYILQQQRNNLAAVNDSYGDGSSAEAGNLSVMSLGGREGNHNNSLLSNPFGTLDTAQRLPRLNKSLADQTSLSPSKASTNNTTSYGAWNKLTKGDLIVR